MGTCSLGKFSVCGHCVTLSSALAYSGGKAIKDLTGRLSLRSVMYLPEGFPHKPLKPSGYVIKLILTPALLGYNTVSWYLKSKNVKLREPEGSAVVTRGWSMEKTGRCWSKGTTFHLLKV